MIRAAGEGATRTKIVATIGPASWAAERIDALLDAGMNVARVNCAHGTHDTLGRTIATLSERAAAKAMPLAILADLGGPKLRVGRFAGGGTELVAGRTFTITTDDVTGDAERVSVNHPGLTRDVKPGYAVFLNDGLIRLEVTGVRGADVETRVVTGGWLGDLKGLSVPAAAISTPSLTAKDLADLDFLARQEIDYVGLSFVRSENDVTLLREELAKRGAVLPVVAKIEKAQAVERLAAVIAAADAVMVARGDLGVECPIEEVPVLQKRIIRACNQTGKPVITATQMLESMTENPRPTRAEASDVANAVLDGSDAVMLSGETATGKHPVEAVGMMRAIIAEGEAFVLSGRGPSEPDHTLGIGEAVGRSACLAARSIGARAIVCLTQSGATARQLARWRPAEPILGVTPLRETWRRLGLLWGVQPILAADFSSSFNEECRRICERLREQGRLPAGAPVVITAGLPFSERGRTNTVRIETI
jgi:pyruvate kinase